MVKEGGVDAIKLEGGIRRKEEVEALTKCGIAVMGHIGLTPQSVGVLGGYKIQGKSCIFFSFGFSRVVDNVMKLIEDAKALEEAGCFGFVIECVGEFSISFSFI